MPQLGRTSVEVTSLGYGSWDLRGREGFGPETSEDAAYKLLNATLDAGINPIDTSPNYGRAEQLIRQSDLTSPQRALPGEQVWLPSEPTSS